MGGAAPAELSHAAVAQALERHLKQNPQERGRSRSCRVQGGGGRVSPRYHYLPWVREGAAHAIANRTTSRRCSRAGRASSRDCRSGCSSTTARASTCRCACTARATSSGSTRAASCAPTRSRARPTSSRTTSLHRVRQPGLPVAVHAGRGRRARAAAAVARARRRCARARREAAARTATCRCRRSTCPPPSCPT